MYRHRHAEANFNQTCTLDRFSSQVVLEFQHRRSLLVLPKGSDPGMSVLQYGYLPLSSNGEERRVFLPCLVAYIRT